jgi:hypothetical protein
MSEPQIHPGWWFTTQWAEVAPARSFHKRFLEKARILGRYRPQLARAPEGWGIAWGHAYWPGLIVYPVSRNAPRILDALAALVKQAGLDQELLQRQVQSYHDWHAGRETAQGVAGHLASVTARAQEERQRQAGHPNPVAYFFQPQRLELLAPALQQFVTDYGPLVTDFGEWLTAGAHLRVARGHPAVEPLWQSPLARIGADIQLWPEEWQRWATSIHIKLAPRRDPPLLAPAPAGFYLWGAAMLTALHQHPEWPGCQLFLASRLASLRLLPDDLLLRSAKTEPTPLATTRLWGNLLDYLALAATTPRMTDDPMGLRFCARPECGESFIAMHRGRRYCDQCSNSRVHALMASRRYRRKKAARV